MSDSFLPPELQRLEIPGRVRVLAGNGGLLKVDVTTDQSDAEIYLQGAHVTEFRKRGEVPILFMSQCSRFEAHQPIRGGVPIIFPWFGPKEGDVAHGFGRTADWSLVETKAPSSGVCELWFEMKPVAAAAAWPLFTASFAVTVSNILKMDLTLRNTSSQVLVLENCMHTYLRVGQIQATRVLGLRGVRFLDKMDQLRVKEETREEIPISEETDRVYMDTTSTVDILDTALKRRIRVEKRGSDSTVLWNPWIRKSQQLSDFGDLEYLEMVCVESGNIGQNRLQIPPGGASTLSVVLSSEPLKS